MADSNAERQRRYIARLKASAATSADAVRKLEAQVARLKVANARLRAEAKQSRRRP
jgi:hypothetical protein